MSISLTGTGAVPGTKEPDAKAAAATVGTLATALLPLATVRKIANVPEKELLAVANMIVSIVNQTAVALTKHQLKLFDPLVGDYSCELHALQAARLTQSASLQKEAAELSAKLSTSKILDSINQRRNALTQYRSSGSTQTAHAIFNAQIANVAVSEDLATLLQMRLLNVTRLIYAKDDAEREKTDAALLDKISGTSSKISTDLKRDIVGELQARVNRASLANVRAEAAKITSIAASELALLQKMLANTRETAVTMMGDGKPYAIPATHRKVQTCLVHKVKAVMARLQETQAVVAVKKMVNRGQEKEAFTLFYHVTTAGGPFERIADDAASKIADSTPVIVLEGDVRKGTNRDELAAFIAKQGLARIILANAAEEAPIGPGTTLKDVAEEARAEIEGLRAVSKAIDCVKGNNPFFLLDHVSLNSKRYEQIK